MDLREPGKSVCMATTVDARPVTVNTRDGVDTRNQDLTTRLGAGDQVRGGQTAARCEAVTKAGRPCECRARPGFTTCGRHKNVAVVNLTVCGERKSNGTYCQKACAEGDTKCKLHRTVLDRREQERRSRELRRDAWDLLWGGNPVLSFDELAAGAHDAFDRGWITYQTYDILLFWLRGEWRVYQRFRGIQTLVTAQTDLQRLALDGQNVHTKEVNRQTSDAIRFLLETSVPEDQETVVELETAWAERPDRKKVLKDMWKWYGMETCVKQGDYLYQRMLDGLWARIKAHKEREELTKRLWEEAFESVGTCCQGHLSRLANVLVGFTDEVKAEVPVGELLQTRMAAIAAKDIPVEQKVEEARAVCEELKVPEAERAAWLEAF